MVVPICLLVSFVACHYTSQDILLVLVSHLHDIANCHHLAHLVTSTTLGKHSVSAQVLKLKYLNEHVDRLARLATDSTLREELTGFPLAKGSKENISEQHRPGKANVGWGKTFIAPLE